MPLTMDVTLFLLVTAVIITIPQIIHAIYVLKTVPLVFSMKTIQQIAISLVKAVLLLLSII